MLTLLVLIREMFNLVNGKTFNLFTSLTDILSCLIC